MMTVSELHRRYHEDTGIVFSSMYPGCIAETALFREKRPWFRTVRDWSSVVVNFAPYFFLVDSFSHSPTTTAITTCVVLDLPLVYEVRDGRICQ